MSAKRNIEISCACRGGEWGGGERDFLNSFRKIPKALLPPIIKLIV
jgi:hypothetical protein